jgi:alpha-beta hydrolase superfamily lysophospholipase
MQSFLPLKAALLPLCFDPALDEEPAGFAAYRELYQLDIANSSHRIGTINSGKINNREYRLAAQYWLPEKARGTVLIVHGYYDHIGLYHHVIRFFLGQGYAVLGFDLPGHGLSSGARAVIHDFDEYGQAIHDVIHTATPHLPPIVLGFGQSTGCAAWMNYCMVGFPSPVKQLVLFSPLLRPHRWQQQGRWVYTLLHRWIRSLPRTFQINSANREFLEFCRRQDPLQPRLLTVAWVGALKNWLDLFASQPLINLPTLIVQGQQDNTVDWRYNIPHIMQKMPQAQLHYLAEARHHLANESETIRDHIWQIVSDYLNKPTG